MYYLLFETGNSSFFEDNIAGAYCNNFVQNIISLYRSGVFKREGYILTDSEDIEESIKKNGKPLYFLNCQLFPSISCGNTGCAAGHKAVLAHNQLETFEHVMKLKKDAFLKAKTGEGRERLDVQIVLQSYETAIVSQLEVIRLNDHSDHDEYLRLYVKDTDKLKDESDAEGFVYIRAAAGESDYTSFIGKTSLPHLTPCDAF